MAKKYVLGVDLGGTFVKCGLVDAGGYVRNRTMTPTDARTDDSVVASIVAAVETVLKGSGVSKEEIVGVGIGAPGMIDSKKGAVVYSGNLGMINRPLSSKLKKALGLPIRIDNDANCAALGEITYGKVKDFDKVLFLTIGTGIGGAYAESGKLLRGNCGCGGEFGHITLVHNGKKCTCGRNGCWEAYASAIALIRTAKELLPQHKDSILWKEAGTDLLYLNASMILQKAAEDKTAKELAAEYIEMLSEGLAGICNILRPEAVVLSGGISEAGDALAEPLQAAVNKKLFGGKHGPQITVQIAGLKNDAGIIGASLLWM